MSEETNETSNKLTPEQQKKKDYELALEYMKLEDAIDDDFCEAAELFELAGDYKDAPHLMEMCKKLEQEYKDNLSANKKKKKRGITFKVIILIIAAAICAVAAKSAPDIIKLGRAKQFIIEGEYIKADTSIKSVSNPLVGLLGADKVKYELGTQFFKEGLYAKSKRNFETINYKDSQEKASESCYKLAQEYFDKTEFDKAYKLYSNNSDYKDCAQLAEKTFEACYSYAVQHYNDGDYKMARSRFSYEFMQNYKDSAEWAIKSSFMYGKQLLENKKYLAASKAFEQADNYSSSAVLLNEANYLYACELMEKEKFSGARKIFLDLKNYKDSAVLAKECKYLRGIEFYEEGNLPKALEMFSDLPGYKDSDERAAQLKSQQ